MRAAERQSIGGMWDEALRKFPHELIKTGKLKGTVVTAEKHPELYQSIADLAKRSGLPYVPSTIIARELPGGPVWARKLPNAGASPLRIVLVSDSMMDLTKSSISRRMSPELEAVMAHEFSHLKDGAMHAIHGHITPFALPLVAMAGLYLYDKASEKTPVKEGQSKKEYGEAFLQNMNKAADEEIEKCKCGERKNEKHWNYDSDWQAQIINAGRYALVGAVTLGAGLLWARQHSLSAEFRADGFAALHTSPDAIKKALTDLHGVFDEAKKLKPKSEGVSGWIMDKLHWVLKETVHKHPSLPERLNHIDRVAATRIPVPSHFLPASP